MKTTVFYLLVFGALIAWLWNERRKKYDHDLQASIDEQNSLQSMGQLKTNANIMAQPDLWSTLINDYDPEIFNNQSPLNNTQAVDEASIWSQPVFSDFGAANPITKPGM